MNGQYHEKAFVTKIITDFSLSSFVAGLVVILVGMTSSAVLVFQSAQTSGATVAQASSWLGYLCLGMGLLGVVCSIFLELLFYLLGQLQVPHRL